VFAISPDGQGIIFARGTSNSDLRLIENFR
jgi:hypothetical protein